MRSIILLTVFVCVAGAAYSQDQGEKKQPYIVTVGPDGIQRIEVVGGEYFYKPDYIIVVKDVPVELVIKKEPGIVPLNIVIDNREAELAVRESISTEWKIIRFAPRKTGTYNFYCDKKLLFLRATEKKA